MRRSSRRSAVGLAGVAPCLVPSHGHAALIPDASGLLGLRASLAHPWCRRGACGRSCCSLHRITAFSPARAACASVLAALWPSAPPDCLRCAMPLLDKRLYASMEHQNEMGSVPRTSEAPDDSFVALPAAQQSAYGCGSHEAGPGCTEQAGAPTCGALFLSVCPRLSWMPFRPSPLPPGTAPTQPDRRARGEWVP